jgi:hypothetical protein
MNGILKKVFGFFQQGNQVAVMQVPNNEWSAVRARLHKIEQEFEGDEIINCSTDVAQNQNEAIQSNEPKTFLEMLPEISKRPLYKQPSIMNAKDRNSFEQVRLDLSNTHRQMMGSIHESLQPRFQR